MEAEATEAEPDVFDEFAQAVRLAAQRSANTGNEIFLSPLYNFNYIGIK